MISHGDFSYLSASALTDLGRKRKNNEDSVLAMPELGVFCVADGMGGSEAGEVASDTVVRHIERAFRDSGVPISAPADEKCHVVRRALEEANEWIWQHSIRSQIRSCGTTAVVLVFDVENPRTAFAIHVGDSRTYRLRQGNLVQLTKDHSFAALTGVKDEEQIPVRFRSIITRAVGVSEKVNVEVTRVDVAEGDVFLLCSDGLSRMLPDREIEEEMIRHSGSDPEMAALALIDKANMAGGVDNVSVALVRVKGDADEEPSRTLDAGPAAGEAGDPSEIAKARSEAVEQDRTRTMPPRTEPSAMGRTRGRTGRRVAPAVVLALVLAAIAWAVASYPGISSNSAVQRVRGWLQAHRLLPGHGR